MTHVDDDHIGGLIKAFESEDGLTKIARRVLFNSGRLIHEYFKVDPDPEKDISGNFTQAQSTSIAQGNTLERLLIDKKIWHEKVIKQGDVCQLGGSDLHFLSPSEAELEKLLGKWVKEQPSPFTSAANTDWNASYEKLLAGDRFKEDESVTNGSSLSFILRVDGKSFLFLGDAHPTTVSEGLINLGYTKDKPLIAELVKVSHHGSKGNTSAELLSLIRCSKYVVSTDGSRHGLPNKVTLARIHQINSNAEIYFNYEAVLSDVYTKEELTQLKAKVKALSGELKFA
ncbi:hypothetical protein D9M69_519200 [compost metagenome]